MSVTLNEEVLYRPLLNNPVSISELFTQSLQQKKRSILSRLLKAIFSISEFHNFSILNTLDGPETPKSCSAGFFLFNNSSSVNFLFNFTISNKEKLGYTFQTTWKYVQLNIQVRCLQIFFLPNSRIQFIQVFCHYIIKITILPCSASPFGLLL